VLKNGDDGGTDRRAFSPHWCVASGAAEPLSHWGVFLTKIWPSEVRDARRRACLTSLPLFRFHIYRYILSLMTLSCELRTGTKSAVYDCIVNSCSLNGCWADKQLLICKAWSARHFEKRSMSAPVLSHCGCCAYTPAPFVKWCTDDYVTKGRFTCIAFLPIALHCSGVLYYIYNRIYISYNVPVNFILIHLAFNRR